MHALIFASLAVVTTAMPSYIALPADQIAFVDLSAMRLRRVPRQTLAPPPPQLPHALYEQNYQPIPLQQYQEQPLALTAAAEADTSPRLVRVQQDVSGGAAQAAASQYAERPPDFGEYVDFGAHTGDNGAFGWYADFPIDNHGDSGYKK